MSDLGDFLWYSSLFCLLLFTYIGCPIAAIVLFATKSTECSLLTTKLLVGVAVYELTGYFLTILMIIHLPLTSKLPLVTDVVFRFIASVLLVIIIFATDAEPCNFLLVYCWRAIALFLFGFCCYGNSSDSRPLADSDGARVINV